MPELDQVVDELEKINPQTATLLCETIQKIDATDKIKLDWANQCLMIAGSGWHAFESANALIGISVTICTNYGPEDLLARAAYGVKLGGYSFEPAHTYFSGLQDLLNSQAREENWQKLEHVETAGRAIHKKYQHASNLITDYFKSAFNIILRSGSRAGSRAGSRDIQAWSQLAARLSGVERGDLIQFLKLSDLPVPWSSVKILQEKSISACLQLIAVYPQLEKKYGGEFIEDLQPLFVSYAATNQALEPFLDALLAVQGQNRRNLRELLVLLPAIADIRLATSLVTNCHRLPLTNHKLVHEWFDAGLLTAEKNIEAGLAFFDLESSRSIALLEKLKGQVNFSDCKRVLQLYSEAISGRRVRLESLEDVPPAEGSLSAEGSFSAGGSSLNNQQGDYRDLPVADGLSIRLPVSVSKYATAEENFSFYKIALLHQLGYFEFDTFDKIERIERDLAAYQDQRLARTLFRILEDARIDWRLEKKFRGASGDICLQKKQALIDRQDNLISRRAQLLEVLVRCGLGGQNDHFVRESDRADARLLCGFLEKLNSTTAQPEDTLAVLEACYELVSSDLLSSEFEALTPVEQALLNEELPEPISFHGEMDTQQIALNMDILELEESLVTSAEEDTLSLTSPIDPSDLDIQELKKGDVKDALGMLVTDLEHGEVDLDAAEDEDQRKVMAEHKPMPGKISRQVREEFRFLYDEWDYVIEDYRRRWCTLFEIHDLDEEPEFVQDTLSEHRDLAKKVRRQLNKLKPELLRKVRGMPDGDDMDLERTVEAVVDRKMGLSPSENIYIQRQRKDRDVSALFLLDMSASTDDLIPDPRAGPEFKPEDYEDDDFLSTSHARENSGRDTDEQKGKRIIDLEKESVILMAEALEELGDNYSICGFSGYGRERIDYFLCKDFKDPYDRRAKGKIGGIKPCRSTRMGPAIRHATRSLVKTESRIKAMIIISDGYPQDFDYGKDRNSKDYGVRDTTKALNEARQQGVQTFCLTVDPSGHDYLREMCPDRQYMVIQDIAQLPDKLSKVYRSLTG